MFLGDGIAVSSQETVIVSQKYKKSGIINQIGHKNALISV